MNDTLVIVLEEKLLELVDKYKVLAFKAEAARGHAYNAELKVRAMAKLIECESDGEYSEEKILENCGLEKEIGDGEKEKGNA